MFGGLTGSSNSNPTYILPMDPFSNPYYAPFLAAYSNSNPFKPLAAGISSETGYAYSSQPSKVENGYVPSGAMPFPAYGAVSAGPYGSVSPSTTSIYPPSNVMGAGAGYPPMVTQSVSPGYPYSVYLEMDANIHPSLSYPPPPTLELSTSTSGSSSSSSSSSSSLSSSSSSAKAPYLSSPLPPSAPPQSLLALTSLSRLATHFGPPAYTARSSNDDDTTTNNNKNNENNNEFSNNIDMGSINPVSDATLQHIMDATTPLDELDAMAGLDDIHEFKTQATHIASLLRVE